MVPFQSTLKYLGTNHDITQLSVFAFWKVSIVEPEHRVLNRIDEKNKAEATITTRLQGLTFN